jgi:phosphatidylserine decarboxylase
MGEYPSLNAFFTRRLKPGARPIDAKANSIVSPVDALITACGYMEDGKLLEVKGQTYSLAELVNHHPRMEAFQSGYFYVLYLSPRDYHRIHVPVDGVLAETEEIAGRVFPVNHASMTNIRHVLSRNYRVISYLEHPAGQVGVVKVAALNVASIQFVDEVAPSKQLVKGDELAYFEFGSTIVLLLEQGTYEPDAAVGIGSRVKMGERLGTWR